MKQKIDEVLNPSIADYNSLLTPEEIFQEITITKEEYEWALTIIS